MAYIEGVTLSGVRDGRMTCDDGRIVAKAPADPDMLKWIKGEFGDMIFFNIEFRPSAYQLRALARWATETADELEGRP